MPGNRNGSDGHFRLFRQVEVDHAGDVHAIDMIAAENGHQVRIGLLDKIDVLIDGVGGAQVPRLVLRAHLCRHVDDEVALQHPTELPSFAQVLQQRLAAELGKHVDGMNSGINQIAENEIDDPVLASEGHRRLGAFPVSGESRVPLPRPARYPKREGARFVAWRRLLLQAISPPKTVLRQDVTKMHRDEALESEENPRKQETNYCPCSHSSPPFIGPANRR